MTMLELIKRYLRNEIDAHQFSELAPKPITREQIQLALLMGANHKVYMDSLVANLPESDDPYWSGIRKILTRAINDLTSEELISIYRRNKSKRSLVRRYVLAVMGPDALADLAEIEKRIE